MADEEVCNLLSQWGLAEYIPKFQQNMITTLAMAALQSDDIKELFTIIGHRSIFNKNWEDWRRLMHPLTHTTPDVHIECSAKLIARYRYLWLNLSELLQSLGNAYARTYSTYCLFMFFNITIAVYGALSEIVDHGFGFSFKEMGLIVDAAYCSTLLFIFVDCSHKSTLEVAAGVQDTLLSIDVLAVDRPTQKEIDHFIQAIEMNPAVVSLKGYAHVNRELLTSSISMMAIYLIVLMQFKISLIHTQGNA